MIGLYLIPAPLHRAALKVAHALRKQWWRLRRPRVIGCRVLALDEAGRVLLIRHSYGSGRWMPPGGGVGRNEPVIAASVRELREETTCVLKQAREVATIVEDLFGAGNQVHVIAGRVAGEARADGREVIEARFFPLDRLPQDIAGKFLEEIPVWAARYEAHTNSR